MRYIVGFLDDEYDSISNMRRSLAKHGITLEVLDDIEDLLKLDKLVDAIMDKEINCLFVDYDLMKFRSRKWGTTVIRETLDLLPELPCFLITNYVGEGEREKIVPKSCIWDKAIFLEESDSREFTEFVNGVKNQVDCFSKNLELNFSQYELLYSRSKHQHLTNDELRQLKRLYQLLNSYQYIDDIPDILLEGNSRDELKTAVDLLSKIEKKLGEMQ